jgi:hypothetical protein
VTKRFLMPLLVVLVVVFALAVSAQADFWLTWP